MPSFFDLFRRGNLNNSSTQNTILEDLNTIHESVDTNKVSETHIDEDLTDNQLLSGTIESVTESVVYNSPDSLIDLISTSDLDSDKILSQLRSTFSLDTTYSENEEMARDSVVGGAMETITDDASQVDERTQRIVTVECTEDTKLADFLQDFLDSNIGISNRIWTWIFEIVKHGDFKLRRCEYYLGSKKDGVKSVYYEDVVNPYKVTRIEYMGQVLGYQDEDRSENAVKFEKPDSFVHFMSVKNSKKEKVKIAYRNEDKELEEVVCYKVFGTSIVDNARYIFRIVNLLDNMIILSRIARSTQYNLVKVEVGNASPQKTSQILTDVRRRIEGQTKMRKNTGIKSDPSPIPVNSNVYIPTREGRGDIQIDSIVGETDVRGLVDLDYFKDKEFATLKVPKAYLGFGEDAMNLLSNNSLVRIDARYARTVQRVQTVAINGITELCNNYLRFRGRVDDVNKFIIKMRPLDSADTLNRVEELTSNMQAMDSVRAALLDGFSEYIDKAKLLKSLLNLVGLSAADIGSEEFIQILKELEDGTYKEENHKHEEAEEEGGGGSW